MFKKRDKKRRVNQSGEVLSRIVWCSYVNNRETSQRRDVKAIFSGLFEHPLLFKRRSF